MSGDTTTGRTTGLSSLELLAVRNAAADFFDDFAQGDTHRDFNKTGILDLAAECEDLGTLGLFGTHGSKPFSTVEDDLSDVCEGFNVVFNSGLTEQTLDCRERRTGSRFTAVTFDGGHQSGFFAADECARTETDFHIEVEVGTEDTLTEQTVFTSLVDCDLESLDCDRIFCTNVNVTLISADCVAADCHCFDQCMGVTFEKGSVHECTGVTFVGVTDNVLLIGDRRLGERPLTTGREAAAAASAQTGIEDFLDNVIGRHLGQNLFQCEVTVACDVFVDVFRIDDTAVTECNTLLLLVECSIVEGNGCRIGLLFFAGIGVNKAFNDTTLEQVFFNDFGDIFLLDHGVEGSLGINDHDRAECAETETTGHNDLDFIFKTLCLQFSCERVTKRDTAGRSTAGTAADKNV